MSMVTTRLGQRVVAAATHGVDGPRVTLGELEPGGTATVLGVSDEQGTTTSRRLFDLGFAPGADVEVLRRAPLADPVIFRVAGYEVALRRVHARLVAVASGR